MEDNLKVSGDLARSVLIEVSRKAQTTNIISEFFQVDKETFNNAIEEII